MTDPIYFLKTLRTGLIFAFLWGVVVGIGSKIEIRHAIPATPWIAER